MLARWGLLPVRDGGKLAQRLVAHHEPVFAYDRVERGVPRNQDREAQAEEYSEKKAHRLKNMTLCDSTQYVHYLSPTEGGRCHDKRLADEYALGLPTGSVLCQGLGLLGHAPAGVLMEMPHKKPPRGELTFAQLLYNRLLSLLRVVIEHAHRGIKRLRMVQDRVRLRGEWRRDTVMVVARGLHDLHIRAPSAPTRPINSTPKSNKVY
ncbi:transposase family protein [Hymenobacter lapidarius]|nr:transposase family protein [Hymenobacter lapidarius]